MTPPSTDHALTLFTSEDLLYAMAPMDDVMATFLQEHSDKSSGDLQDAWAHLVKNANSCCVSKRYLAGLLRKFVRHIGDENIESEILMDVIGVALLGGSSSGLPHAGEACTLSFLKCEEERLRVRVFPHHNDVALRIWEAGALLAEFLMDRPDLVAGKRVVELGAGTGVTGLAIAGCCGAAQVFCTDFTDVALENLSHNRSINQEWLAKCRPDLDSITELVGEGYLEWNAFGNKHDLLDNKSKSDILFDERMRPAIGAMERAQVLLAADVAYDAEDLLGLVLTIRRFLEAGKGETSADRYALLASTLRNRKTFSILQEKLETLGVVANTEHDGSNTRQPPQKFPVQFVQPRNDVQIARLVLRESVD